MVRSATTTSLNYPTLEVELKTCSVLLYEHLSFVQALWKDGMSEGDYEVDILQVLEIVTRFKIKYLLSDAHQLSDLGDNDWFLKVCVPLLVRSDVQKLARILPFDQIAITQNQILVDVKSLQAERQKLAFDFEGFTDLDSAFNWLNIT